MAVLSSRALHEQLGIIMGALTKAAVAEICELVDEGYAVLQMELTRSHKENEDLRKKLHLIESIVVRGNGGQAEVGPEDAPPAEAARRAETPTELQLQLQADGDGGAPAADPGGGGGAGVAVVQREELPDVVLIKDEDSDSNTSIEEDSRAPADGGTGGAREAATLTTVSRRKKRRRSGPEASNQKTPPEHLAPTTSKVTMATQKLVNVYTLDSPPGETGHPAQLDTEEVEALEAYSSQLDRDVQLVHQECSLVHQSTKRQPSFYGGGAVMESPTSRAELDLSLTWAKRDKDQTAFPHFHQNLDDAFGLKLVSVSGSVSTDSQMSESSNSALEYESGEAMTFALYRDQSHHAQPGSGARGKRYVCSVCSRTYATAQNLDVHMRIHTGERPFSCDQCGKKFTQSAHLKSHLSVHSGERPFTCLLCSRSFIVKYSLKLHMKKCHPNVSSE